MDGFERVLSWNEFQKRERGRSVTMSEWHAHQREVLRKF